jgi:hypothetical protein
MSMSLTTSFSFSHATGIHGAPFMNAMPTAPGAIGHAGSSYRSGPGRLAAFDATASSGRRPYGGRLAAFGNARATGPEDGVALARPRGDLDVEAASMTAPSTMLIVSLLLIGGVFSLRNVLDFFRGMKGGDSQEDALKNPTGRPIEREPISEDDPLKNPTGRPTVAETPGALRGGRPSFGVRIGGESIPGTSIVPPPEPKDGRGGSNIE